MRGLRGASWSCFAAAGAGAELDVPLRGDPVTEPDGGMRSLQIEDPDGNVIQLFELL